MPDWGYTGTGSGMVQTRGTNTFWAGFCLNWESRAFNNSPCTWWQRSVPVLLVQFRWAPPSCVWSYCPAYVRKNFLKCKFVNAPYNYHVRIQITFSYFQLFVIFPWRKELAPFFLLGKKSNLFTLPFFSSQHWLSFFFFETLLSLGCAQFEWLEKAWAKKTNLRLLAKAINLVEKKTFFSKCFLSIP